LTIRMLLLSALFVSSLAASEDAWLLASKSPQSQYGVEGMDYVVQYGLYNVGGKPATKVTLDDRQSYPKEYFDVVQGMLQTAVERLNPGENITHTVVLSPKLSGVFNETAAHISYRPDVHSNQLRSGLTTVAPKMYVYTKADYERRFGSNLERFLAFFVFMSPMTLYSLYAYVSSANK
ncbi:hypothetical protein PMAYCL1PPCAC_24519, partial [Pristionchus mayeri]